MNTSITERQPLSIVRRRTSRRRNIKQAKSHTILGLTMYWLRSRFTSLFQLNFADNMFILVVNTTNDHGVCINYLYRYIKCIMGRGGAGAGEAWWVGCRVGRGGEFRS